MQTQSTLPTIDEIPGLQLESPEYARYPFDPVYDSLPQTATSPVSLWGSVETTPPILLDEPLRASTIVPSLPTSPWAQSFRIDEAFRMDLDLAPCISPFQSGLASPSYYSSNDPYIQQGTCSIGTQTDLTFDPCSEIKIRKEQSAVNRLATVVPLDIQEPDSDTMGIPTQILQTTTPQTQASPVQLTQILAEKQSNEGTMYKVVYETWIHASQLLEPIEEVKSFHMECYGKLWKTFK